MAPNAKVQKFLPGAFLQTMGKNLPGIVSSFNDELEVTEKLIQACVDQLFLTTASGNYLIKLGESEGFIIPENSGLDIRSYRVLVPIMVAAPKQVRVSINELIEAFYQDERSRPSFVSTIAGPYSLVAGDDLSIETESGTTTIAITANQVSDLSNVSPQELSAVINTAQNAFRAETTSDRSTGAQYIRIISSTLGTGSFIRVAGGKLQNVLKFPKLIDTQNSSATTWNLTKTSVYIDFLKFTWDGTGTNPNVYLAKKNDVVTIRGLVDGISPLSVLNGSYDIVDVGYDYFIIRNDQLDLTSATLLQPSDNSIVFTKADTTTLFDANEYALTTETKAQTITITIPAVPPLVRRFLQGSAHIPGAVYNVEDFTRTTIRLERTTGQELAVPDNQFILTNKTQRSDFTKKYFKTESFDSSASHPTYNMNISDDQYSVLPYTVATQVNASSESIYGSIGSDEFRLTFPFSHGLSHGWGFTLANGTGAANIMSGNINKEQQVQRVESDDVAIFRMFDTNGSPIVFTGIAWSAADVYRQSATQFDGSDFYLEFGTTGAAIASGLTAGITFKLDTTLGTNVDTFLANLLRFRTLTVTSVNGSKVNFSAGLGVGNQGLIITSVPGKRSGTFGSTALTYFLDKTSDINEFRVFDSLRAMFLGYSKSSNLGFLGPYLYDPDGEETSVTVSKYLIKTTQNIFKGDSRQFLMVDDSDLDGEFPANGSVIIDYGSSGFEGPIPYFSYVKNLGTTQIMIDPAYRFKKSHDSGAQIQFIHASAPYVPSIDGADYPFYLTGSTTSRNALIKLIKLLVAAGIFVDADVITPDLRYADTAIQPFA